MDYLQESIARAREIREQALTKSPREFGVWAGGIQNEALDLSKQICGTVAELNKWMALADRNKLTCVEGMLIGIENMRRDLGFRPSRSPR